MSVPRERPFLDAYVDIFDDDRQDVIQRDHSNHGVGEEYFDGPLNLKDRVG